MKTTRNYPGKYAFWLLIGLITSLISLAIGIMWHYHPAWLQILWHTCQNNWGFMIDNLPVIGLASIPFLILVMVIRLALTLNQQIQTTRQFVKQFSPFRSELPLDLQHFFQQRNIPLQRVVYLNWDTPHAFCLGFWMPRIWLTAGMVNLLSETELIAVLTHEIHHYHHYDPLQLLISRSIKGAFSFLPGVGLLTDLVELHQEMAADQRAIVSLQDDLPLLCALQKLLKYKGAGTVLPPATYNAFNITEARLQQLIQPKITVNISQYCLGWGANLMILAFLAGSLIFSSHIAVNDASLSRCTIEENPVLQTEISSAMKMLNFDQ